MRYHVHGSYKEHIVWRFTPANRPSYSPFLLLGAYILVLGNLMPAVVAYTEGRQEVIAQGNPGKEQICQGLLSDEVEVVQ